MKSYDEAPNGAVSRARRLRRDATDAEKVLWRKLRESLPAAKFRRQSPVGPYIADFLSFGQRLVVEVDGSQHAIREAQDAKRTAFLEAQGYRVLRFWNGDVLENPDGVLQVIAAALANTPSPVGRGRGPLHQQWEGEGR